MFDSCKNITEIQNYRNRFTIIASDIFFIIQDGLLPIMAADIFVTHGDKASAVIIGIGLA